MDSAQALRLYAYRLLAARAYTESELRSKLEQKAKKDGCDATSVNAILNDLLSKKWLDDTSVAEQIVTRRGIGHHRKQLTLEQRGLSVDAQQQAWTQWDREQELLELQELIQKYGHRWSSAGPKGYNRAYGFLARRGFSARDIRTALQQWMNLDSDAEDQ